MKYEVESSLRSYLTLISFNSIIYLLSYSFIFISLFESIIFCKSIISLLTSSCNCFSLLHSSTAFFNLMKFSISVGFTFNSTNLLDKRSIVFFTFVINTLGITFLILSIHFFGASETSSNKSSN